MTSSGRSSSVIDMVCRAEVVVGGSGREEGDGACSSALARPQILIVDSQLDLTLSCISSRATAMRRTILEGGEPRDGHRR